MLGVVVPFRAAPAKTRLALPTAEDRAALALAMLADVVAACVAVAPTTVVGSGEAARLARELGAAHLNEPPGGQGAAVQTALETLRPQPALVVNSDLPCVTRAGLEELADAIPAGGLALVEAADGTTNALGLADAGLFAPLYGPGSAARFQAHARAAGAKAVSLPVPNIAEDVDTRDDLERLEARLGPRTRAALAALVQLSG